MEVSCFLRLKGNKQRFFLRKRLVFHFLRLRTNKKKLFARLAGMTLTLWVIKEVNCFSFRIFEQFNITRR